MSERRIQGNWGTGRRTPEPPHPSCTHKQYLLTCDEYETLRAASRSRCQMCGRPGSRLVIDHDHAIGNWAVRGLICDRCNISLGVIEGGKAASTAPARRYLASPWHQKQGWGEDRAKRMRERVKCTVCARMVGAMLNGAPYPHHSEESWDVECPGSRVVAKLPTPKKSRSAVPVPRPPVPVWDGPRVNGMPVEWVVPINPTYAEFE